MCRIVQTLKEKDLHLLSSMGLGKAIVWQKDVHWLKYMALLVETNPMILLSRLRLSVACFKAASLSNVCLGARPPIPRTGGHMEPNRATLAPPRSCFGWATCFFVPCSFSLNCFPFLTVSFLKRNTKFDRETSENVH